LDAQLATMLGTVATLTLILVVRALDGAHAERGGGVWWWLGRRRPKGRFTLLLWQNGEPPSVSLEG
jgi:hypothetical protein